MVSLVFSVLVFLLNILAGIWPNQVPAVHGFNLGFANGKIYIPAIPRSSGDVVANDWCIINHPYQEVGMTRKCHNHILHCRPTKGTARKRHTETQTQCKIVLPGVWIWMNNVYKCFYCFSGPFIILMIWALAWENLSSVDYKQQRRRPAWAYGQSDQHLCCLLIGKNHI